jgi:hypothetical protein
LDIRVIKIDPSTRRITLKLGFDTISGLTKLVQIVVLSLLNVPGRDVLDPDAGAGLPDMIGMNIAADDTTEIFAEVALRVRKSQSEIISSQIGLSVSQEEKLKEIQIVSIDRGQEIDEIFVRLRIINELGRAAEVVM